MFAKLVRRMVVVLVFGCGVFGACPVYGLPWDTDMYQQQSLKPGEITRAPAHNSVPIGIDHQRLEAVKENFSQKNPIPADGASLARGQQLWKVHCAICHGGAGDGTGPVGPLIGAANLLGGQYPERTDQQIFSVIFTGLRAMPRQGYKLAPDEAWDIINFVRQLQRKGAGKTVK